MAEPGEYGDIASRAAFRARLAELLEAVTACAAQHPDLADPLGAIREELEGIQRATANGRDPGEDDRGDLQAGVIAIRELEGAPDEDVTDVADALHPVLAFYEDWPTDEEAAALSASGPSGAGG
ncbi:MAG: hypothetical protein U0414_19295 [Polyangiaceae bacterium]